MPRNETVLQVFIASPSNVQAERDALDAVVTELNQTWSRRLGIRLEVVRWETHAFPGFGDDAQDVINRQLPQDYDLFIGVMWARFGSPTSRYSSGTAEEFARALARFRENRNSVHLMMYFKTAALPLEDIDPAQLTAVREFRAHVEAEGGLHWSFETTEDFANLVRLHLPRFIQGWQEAQAHPAAVSNSEHLGGLPSEPEPVSSSADAGDPGGHGLELADGSEDELDREEEGLIDLVELGMERIADLSTVQNRLTQALQELGTDTDREAAEMTRATQVAGASQIVAVKRATNRLADAMNRFVRIVKPEVEQFSVHFEDTIAITGRIASLSLDFGSDSDAVAALPMLANQVEEMATTLGRNAASTKSFRDTVGSLPRVTTAFNRAKRATVGVLDLMAREFETASQLGLQAAETIRAMGPQPRDLTQAPQA